jgi:hypothetical protein
MESAEHSRIDRDTTVRRAPPTKINDCRRKIKGISSRFHRSVTDVCPEDDSQYHRRNLKEWPCQLIPPIVKQHHGRDSDGGGGSLARNSFTFRIYNKDGRFVVEGEKLRRFGEGFTLRDRIAETGC